LAPLRALPCVGDVRGRGLLAGIEFVEDKETRAPFPRAAHFAETFADAALDAGLVVWPNVGQADGTNGDIALLAPPFVITDDDIALMVSRFRMALEATVAAVLAERAAPATATNSGRGAGARRGEAHGSPQRASPNTPGESHLARTRPYNATPTDS
jgi:hypothetical protein